jgi:hypothetical protein
LQIGATFRARDVFSWQQHENQLPPDPSPPRRHRGRRLPVGPAAASIAFTLVGMLAVLLSDYGREIEPVRAQASVIPFHFAARNPANLDRAA